MVSISDIHQRRESKPVGDQTHPFAPVCAGRSALLICYTTRANRAACAQHLASQLVDATHCNDIDVIVLNDAPPELAVAAIDAGAPLLMARDGAVHAFIRDTRLRLADLQPFLARTRRVKLEALVR
jgi:hypothetical protein